LPEPDEKQGQIQTETEKPILADLESQLDALDRIFDTGLGREIAEGRRIQFFEGKRKVKDGTTKKTGHHYWEWVYKDPDTGKRKRPYGGTIRTVPNLYQYRIGQYQALIHSRSTQSLADALLRPALNELRSFDTG
jgi:hypothetical protein